MKMISLNKNSYAFKHALRVGVALIIAWIVNHTLSMSGEYWVVLSAFLVCQTTMGTPVRQGYIVFTVIEISVIASAVLTQGIAKPWATYLALFTVFFVTYFGLFFNRPVNSRAYFQGILFVCIMMVALLAPEHAFAEVQDRVMDIFIGSLIGIVIVSLLRPARLDLEFSEGIIPLLNAIRGYFQVLSKQVMTNEVNQETLSNAKLNISALFERQEGMYPEWVYDVGFNRGLRSGFRFFLIHLEKVTEIIISINFILKRGLDPSLLQSIAEPLATFMKKNDELFEILITYFQERRLSEIHSNFTSDMDELEEAVKKIIPRNVEALEVAPHYLHLAEWMRDMRDLRGVLLQLAMALPAPQKPS